MTIDKFAQYYILLWVKFLEDISMADRDSAEIFGFVFTKLAELPRSTDRDRVAQEILAKSEDYDFTDDQMNANEALQKLGLKRSY